MSTSYTVDIHCDRCGVWMHGAIGPKPTGLATKAVAVAKRAGWTRVNNALFMDLCPKCVDDIAKGKQP